MRNAISLSILIITLNVQAGNRVGNGGHVIACSESGKIQILDFYRAHGFEAPPAEITGDDEYKIAGARFDKLKPMAEKLHRQYVNRLATIKADLEFRKGEKLTEVKDSLHDVEPADNDCKVHQLIIRREKITPEEKPFVVNQDLWDKLSPVQKAGMLTHEIIYEHFARLGEKDSANVRRLNAHLYSKEIENQSTGKFWLMIKEFRIPLYP